MFIDRPCCGANVGPDAYCQEPALANGRCRLHGGMSCGPRTPEGLEASRRARLKHGRYSAVAIAARRDRAAELRRLFELASEAGAA